MAVFAQVVVNVSQVQGAFDYHIPPELAGQVQVGCLVVVPFGPQLVQGVVLRLMDEASVLETRPIQALVDPQPVVNQAQLDLAVTLAEQTLSPLAACLDLMLPPGLTQMADTLYSLLPGQSAPVESMPQTQRQILELLQRRGDLRARQLEASLAHVDVRRAAQALVRQGRLVARPVLPPPSVRPKVVRMVQLAVAPQDLPARDVSLGRGAAGERRRAVLDFLLREPWPVNVAWAYASSGGNLSDLLELAEQGLVILSESEVWRDPLEKMEFVAQQPPELTSDQQTVWLRVQQALQSLDAGKTLPPHLLYGVTGSGKTEIYLRAVEATLRLGRSAVVLVPEIALTPQTVRRFVARFPGQVGLIHSKLSLGERYDTWRRARAGLLRVIVGPRSALFAPLPNLGLIVIDEFHEESYYQEDPEPRYHAVQAAQIYARLSHSLLLVGSATPEVSWLQHAEQSGWPVLRMPLRILAHRQTVQSQMRQIQPLDLEQAGQDSLSLPLPQVQLVDMREELKADNRSIFSRVLRERLQQTLDAHQQAILYLNRRGSSTYVFCRACGAALRCPRCDIPLTLHTAAGQTSLLCHRCNYHRQMPAQCPQCGSRQIRQFGTGTEKVEAEVLAAFPGVRTLRWDAETTTQKGSHELIMAHFANHRADVLVGTQMLAKGLDLPFVTLVGVVLADVGLNLPDYRAAERTFQLLVQVSGRAGRSPLGGKVVLQTFQPEHYVLQYAARQDFDGFYQHELGLRRAIGYPPFSRLVRLVYRHRDSQQAAETAQRFAAQLRFWLREGEFEATEIIGPAPCFFERMNAEYRWQIVLRGPNPAAALRGKALGDWRVEVDPPSLL